MKTIKINENNSIPHKFTVIVESENRDKFWYKEGNLHRENGPAIEFLYGIKFWHKEGKFHRLNGPAIECPDGTKEWYIEGNFYSPEKLSDLINSSLFLGKEKGNIILNG